MIGSCQALGWLFPLGMIVGIICVAIGNFIGRR